MDLRGGGTCNYSDIKNISLAIIYLVFAIVFSTPIAKKLSEQRFSKNGFFKLIRAVLIIALFIMSMASITSSSYNPFIYFNF